MAENKTKQTNASVEAFLDSIPDEQKRRDSYTILKMMKKISGEKPYMWGTSIVGFGKIHYKYVSGHEGETCLLGFSPRKQNLTLYVLSGYTGPDKLLARLGKHKRSKVCLYINKLSDVDLAVLEELIVRSKDEALDWSRVNS